jgi:hypothetical protein
MQLEQSLSKKSIVLSPFGGIVPYQPVKNKLLRTFYHVESTLMAFFLKYIEQHGKTEEYF